MHRACRFARELGMVCLAVLVIAGSSQASLAAELRAGFGAVDITPPLDGKRPVYIAGYGMNRKATGVHDPIMARAAVLQHGDEKVALVSVDLVGLQLPTVQLIRDKLTDFKYVMVASTHNHEGPDVIGIWGRGPFHRGVDDAYLDQVVEGVVKAVRAAAEQPVSVKASFGTAEDDSLLGDSRLPYSKDGVLRAIRLDDATTGKPAGLIVQWNCHPESLGSKNTLLTADFNWATVAKLGEQYDCPVVLISGAVGGLMAPPDDRVRDRNGNLLKDGNFEYAEAYGNEVAALAAQAIAKVEPIELAPFAVSTKPVMVPVTNSLYRLARTVGVMKRDARVWMGDSETLGEKMTEENVHKPTAIETEVAYLRLGELHIACIPGELYPELVYGKFQEPVEPNVDFPDAPLEPTVAEVFEGKRWMLFGLANDEIGYIIPKRQWDKAEPFAYGKDGGQYGEINSCSPDVAPIIMEALKRRVGEVAAP
jgi:hypothetical protein